MTIIKHHAHAFTLVAANGRHRATVIIHHDAACEFAYPEYPYYARILYDGRPGEIFASMGQGVAAHHAYENARDWVRSKEYLDS